MMQNLSKIIPFENDFTKKANVQLHLGFFDLLPISGNKWFKLRYNLQNITPDMSETVLSFGGAYSNHLFALAEAGEKFGFKTIGIVRGEEVLPLNTLLEACKNKGMQLFYVSRTIYRQKNDPNFLAEIKEKYQANIILPEGGSNAFALRGCLEIADYFEEKFDFYCLSAGTGGTASGLAMAANEKNFKVEVFSSLKNGSFLIDEMKNLQTNFALQFPIYQHLANLNAVNLHTHYDFGGYGKTNPILDNFILDFFKQNKLTLDRIYTAKMFFGVLDLIKKDYFPENSKILILLTKGNERGTL